LKATAGRGLQPAMDFILENEGKPVPDASNVMERDQPKGEDGDEDEDMRLAISMSQGGADQEAKVCFALTHLETF
jgi:hypothetical protein